MKLEPLNQTISLLLCLGVLLGSLAWPEPVLAQDSHADGSGNYWRHYNTSNSDLPSNNVQAIAYTEDVNVDVAIPGLWVGTDAGLSYTNGRDWIDYTAADSDLPDGDVRAFLNGHKAGELWIGTDGGVARLDYAGTPRDREDDTWKVFTAADGLPSGDVLSLALGPADQVWVGTVEGLARYDGVTWRAYTAGLPGPEIRDLAYDAGRDGLWVATGDGVGMLDLDSEAWTIFHAGGPGGELPSDDVRALALSEDGRVWMGTAGGLAVLAPDGAWETWGLGKPGLPNYPVTDLSLDPSGRYLWVTIDGDGASRYDIPADHWDRFNTLGSGLPDDHVRVVLASHESVAWLGTAAGLSGVERMWETLLAGSQVLAGLVDPETGAVWVVTDDGGVSRSTDGGASWQTYTTADGLGDDDVRAVWRDSSGGIWVGTEGGGLSRSVDGGANWQTFTTADGLGANEVWAVWGDDVGTVCIGTLGGGVSRLASAADLAPIAGWLAPAQLVDGRLLHLLGTRTFEAQFMGLSLAPTSAPADVTYTIVLSHVTSGQVFSTTFAAGEIGATDIVSVSFGDESSLLPFGKYDLLLTATDLFGRYTTTRRVVRVQTAMWLLAGAVVVLTLVVVSAAGVSSRLYLAYARQWAAAKDYPLQQLIALVAPLGKTIASERLGQWLHAIQAFSTGEQVQDALDALVERGLMRREGDDYRFVSPQTARVHRRVYVRHTRVLTERVRMQYPLYVRVREFFAQAHFRVEELDAEEFLLSPRGQDHPQARYGPVYARLVTGRSPAGEDFTAVCDAARWRYGDVDDDMSHRVAMVISDRRPEPGARYRLYEIRQREGLAIVPLDSALFGQIKPNRTAGDILAAEIDQATGQQNLYKISGPVSGDLSFFGRERVLQEVMDLLDGGQPVGIFGLRKTGKTSLIQRLQGRLAGRRPIAFVDTQTTVRQQGVWPLYPAIVAGFAGHLQRYRPDLALPDLRLCMEAVADGSSTFNRGHVHH